MEGLTVTYFNSKGFEVNSVPATAPAQFQAGVYNGFTGQDLREQILGCFKPDQDLADDTNGLIKAIEDKNFSAIKDLVEGDEDEALVDVDDCLNDPDYTDVANAYMYQILLVEKAMADPDW